MSGAFNARLFAELCAERGLGLGTPCHAVAVTGSTNDDALAAARCGASDGTTFVADAQTAGRGRRGNRWFAVAGESLLCTVVLRRKLAPRDVPALALVAGLAIRSAVESTLRARGVTEATVSVKWPNDVWVDQKKIAGVLAESQLRGETVLAAVVGFGINVATTAFPDELAERVTSLRLSGVEASREVLLRDVLAALDDHVERLCRDGVGSFSDELSRHDALVGRRLRLVGGSGHDGDNGHKQGVAAGIDAEGCLILRAESGEIFLVRGGAVELLD